VTYTLAGAANPRRVGLAGETFTTVDALAATAKRPGSASATVTRHAPLSHPSGPGRPDAQRVTTHISPRVGLDLRLLP